MINDPSKVVEEELNEKNAEIKELEEKLIETEKKLIELNKDLENRVIERTVEVNRLLIHKNRFIDNLSHDLGTPLTPLITLLPAIKENVAFVPGNPFYTNDAPCCNTFRLNFSNSDKEMIEEGIKRLGKVIGESNFEYVDR